jgi:hypothetical protein
MNAEHDFYGYNYGDFVQFWWADIPAQAYKIILYRASSPEGPWTQIRDYPVETLAAGSVDFTDGRKNDLYYRSQAESSIGTSIKN